MITIECDFCKEEKIPITSTIIRNKKLEKYLKQHNTRLKILIENNNTKIIQKWVKYQEIII
jgi:hypothetical protein